MAPVFSEIGLDTRPDHSMSERVIYERRGL